MLKCISITLCGTYGGSIFFLSFCLYATSANHEKKNVKSTCLIFTAPSKAYLVMSMQSHGLFTKSKDLKSMKLWLTTNAARSGLNTTALLSAHVKFLLEVH